MMKARNSKHEARNWVVAKSPDGSVQINFTIAFDEIEKARQKALVELSKDVLVPGFRKGMAPVEKAKEKISKEKLLEKTLMSIVPRLLSEAIESEKIKPATYPKIELIKAEENEPWEVRVLTCELPIFDLPDYKALIKTLPKPEGQTREQKIETIIKLLLDSVQITIPAILVDEEVNARLSSLLERIEKLGLNLEGYLASVGKTPETLRTDYTGEANRAIGLELILNDIAQRENIDVTPEKVEEAIHATEATHPDHGGASKHEHSEQQKSVVRSILRRSAVLDSLVALM